MPKTSTLTESKNLRYTKDEAKAWTHYARAAGLSLNAWLRAQGNLAAAGPIVVRCTFDGCEVEATAYSAREASLRGTKPYCAGHKGGRVAK